LKVLAWLFSRKALRPVLNLSYSLFCTSPTHNLQINRSLGPKTGWIRLDTSSVYSIIPDTVDLRETERD
jgi:hypothetical protein